MEARLEGADLASGSLEGMMAAQEHSKVEFNIGSERRESCLNYKISSTGM